MRGKCIRLLQAAAFLFFVISGSLVPALVKGAQAPGDGQEVSCDAFMVTVPEEIMEIADVETDADGIAFYEKISHPTSGGFVGKIELYENVEDYCNIPNFGRGGEIISADGEKKDVVLVYPSDVQSDVSNQESMDNWSRIREAFDNSIVNSIDPADDGEYVPQSDMDNTGIYDAVLEKLREKLKAHADQTELEEEGFSYIYAFLYGEGTDFAEEIGYGFVDLTGTGYPQLIIMGTDGEDIYDMFGQSDGEVIHLFSGAERDRFRLSGHDGKSLSLREDASGGAELTEISFYELDPLQKELNHQVTFCYDGQAESEKIYTIQYISGEDAESVTEEEWNQRIENYGEILVPELKTLSVDE